MAGGRRKGNNAEEARRKSRVDEKFNNNYKLRTRNDRVASDLGSERPESRI